MLNQTITYMWSVITHYQNNKIEKILWTHQTKYICIIWHSIFTINIINFEEKFNFIFWWLTSKLMNGIYEFLEWYWTRIVFVKYLKNSIREKWLKNRNWNLKKWFFLCIFIASFWAYILWCDDFFEIFTSNFLLISHCFAKQLLESL